MGSVERVGRCELIAQEEGRFCHLTLFMLAPMEASCQSQGIQNNRVSTSMRNLTMDLLNGMANRTFVESHVLLRFFF